MRPLDSQRQGAARQRRPYRSPARWPLLLAVSILSSAALPSAWSGNAQTLHEDWCAYLGRMENAEWDSFGVIDGEGFQARFWPLMNDARQKENPELLLEHGADVNALDDRGLTDSREEVLKQLGLTVGMAIDEPTLAWAELQLFRSGRFLAQSVSPVWVHGASPKAKVRVELTEYPGLPRLSEPLSGTEEALLRFCDWASGFKDRDEDLVVTVAGIPWKPLEKAVFNVVLSPRNGLLVEIGDSGESGRGSMPDVLLLGPNEAGWFSPGSKTKLLLNNPELTTVALLTYRTVPNVGDAGAGAAGRRRRVRSGCGEGVTRPRRALVAGSALGWFG